MTSSFFPAKIFFSFLQDFFPFLMLPLNIHATVSTANYISVVNFCNASLQKQSLQNAIALQTLQKEKETVQKENETLRKAYETVQKEKEALQKETETFQKEKDALQKEKDTLQKENETIQNELGLCKENQNK
jgi:predicted nuclease with TOPRIM domain